MIDILTSPAYTIAKSRDDGNQAALSPALREFPDGARKRRQRGTYAPERNRCAGYSAEPMGS